MHTKGVTLNFVCVICVNLFFGAECATISNSKHPKLVVLSYDGFRFDYMEKTNTPTLDSLKSQGVHTPYMQPQFTTKTFPNHQSIVTGLHTESHGIMDNQVYDPEHGQLSGYDSYNEEFWNFRDDVVPVWILNQWAENGRFSGSSWPGSNHPYGKNKTVADHYLTYNRSLSFEDRIEYVVDWLTDKEKPANLVFMYFDEPDGMGHTYGPESPEVIKEIQRMDKVTKHLVNRLKEEGLYEKVNIIILSDHGFQEVSLKNYINITALVNLDSIEKPYIGTPITQLRPKPGKFEEVYKGLKEGSKSSNFSVYKKEELPKRWFYGDNRRIMPIVVIADLGHVFDDYANRYKKLSKKLNITYDENRKFGIHGYDNNAVTMRAFFLAHGPAFKKGVEIPAFDNVDLFPLICSIMDLEPAPNNGTLKIVQQALSSYTSTATSILKTNYLSSLKMGIMSLLLSSSLMLHIGS